MNVGFQQFWDSYPRRVGKLAAMKEWDKAIRLDTVENILAGVERYKRHMPSEVQFIPHPRTFLSQGRWMDEETEAVIVPAKEYWADECTRIHGGACTKQWDHEMRKREAS